MSVQDYWIYMLECENGAYYTGYTTDLVRRFRQHLDGTANVKYTRSHRPLRIAQCWRLQGRIGLALQVERLVKTSGRRAKERLIERPDQLRSMAAARLGIDLDVSPVAAHEVEVASRRILPSEHAKRKKKSQKNDAT